MCECFSAMLFMDCAVQAAQAGFSTNKLNAADLSCSAPCDFGFFDRACKLLCADLCGLCSKLRSCLPLSLLLAPLIGVCLLWLCGAGRPGPLGLLHNRWIEQTSGVCSCMRAFVHP